jgi:two-component system, OmpR family, sensor histidine kinase VicK
VESSEDAIIGKTLDGIITTWNPSAERMYGYTADEVVGRSIAVLVPAEHPDELPAILERLKAGEVVANLETERVRKDGSRLHVALTISPIRDDAGRVLGASTIARDITARVWAEREREALLLRAQEAQQVAEAANRAKDVFLSTAAHELKTPLTAMKAYAQLLQRLAPAAASERLPSMLAALVQQTDRLSRLVNDLLDVSRLALGRLDLRLERLDLADVVADVVAQLQPTTGRHQLRFDALASAVVDGDRDRLMQVLFNLLHNAIKFSPAGGDIHIRVEVQAPDAVVSVQDSGVGIPRDQHERIFEQFYQAHVGTADDFGGMGIGLHLSREFIRAHGGEMWFTSEAGRGSTFSFRLPLAQDRDDGRER